MDIKNKMINLKYKNLFFDLIILKNKDFLEDQHKLIAFDYFYYKGYTPWTTLKKCYYNHYAQFEIDLFRYRILISSGYNKQVPYELGLKEYKTKRDKCTKDK